MTGRTSSSGDGLHELVVDNEGSQEENNDGLEYMSDVQQVEMLQ
ncbi:MAG: hypothetical protein AAFO15_00745 [Pseudomonadota bacterium]